ncbi:MAG: hypothetical protein ACOCZD_00615 [Haloferacaceae archaeon]
MSDRHHVVSQWSDVQEARAPSNRDKQRVATIFSEQSWDHVVWLPEWLLEEGDKNVETVEASDHLAVGDVEDYTEKAWSFRQPHAADVQEFLPKSAVTVFERHQGVERIDTPQRGLGSFAVDADG